MLRGLSVCLVVMGLAASPASAKERIALVIGNSAYEKTGWRLENPARDATLVAQSLEAVGFTVNLVLDADRDAMTDAIRDFGRALRAGGEDAVGFAYFAGHGMQSQGINYLLPIDIDAQVEQDVWAFAPRAGLITSYMESAGNALNFLVLDACRDNPLPAASRSAGAGGLAPIGRSSGVLYAYSTAPGLTASDGEGDFGPYAQALANYIARPGIPAEIMFKRVAEAVEDATNFAQQPFYESGLRGEEFYFGGLAGSGAPEPAPRPTPVTQPGPEPEPEPESQNAAPAGPAAPASAVDPGPGGFIFGGRVLAGLAERSIPGDPMSKALARADAADVFNFSADSKDLVGPPARFDAFVARMKAALEADPELIVHPLSGCSQAESRRASICGGRGAALYNLLKDNGVPTSRLRGSENWGHHRPIAVEGLTAEETIRINQFAWARLVKRDD